MSKCSKADLLHKKVVIKTDYTTYIVCWNWSAIINFSIHLYTVNHVNSNIVFIMVSYLRLLKIILQNKVRQRNCLKASNTFKTKYCASRFTIYLPIHRTEKNIHSYTCKYCLKYTLYAVVPDCWGSCGVIALAMFSVLDIIKTYDSIRQRCLNLYVVFSYLSFNRIKHVIYVLRLILWPNFLNPSTKHIKTVN